MPTDGDQSSLLEALHMLIREVWPRRHVAKYWLLIGLDPGLSFHHYCCSPRFNSPYHPSSTGLAERAVGNVKTIICKLAVEHPRDWHNVLTMVMWCLREVENETTGVAPWTLVMGHLPRGPLAILKES